MLVDTGASIVTLSASDAELVGLHTANLHYTEPISTANGNSLMAPVQLENIVIGPVGAASVTAFVAQPGKLEYSLLGMRFLGRLKSFEVSGDTLTLRN